MISDKERGEGYRFKSEARENEETLLCLKKSREKRCMLRHNGSTSCSYVISYL